MKKFKDGQAREWELALDVGTAKRVRSATGVDIFNLFQTEAQRVFSDPCLLVDVLYVMCEQQCKQRNVSDEDFGRALCGDPIEHAATALLEEVADFFPQRRRTILRATITKAEQMAIQLEAKALQSIEQMDLSSVTRLPAS